MKQKHYLAIAQAIKENTHYFHTSPFASHELILVEKFLPSLCDILKAENKNFNKEKFMEAMK